MHIILLFNFHTLYEFDFLIGRFVSRDTHWRHYRHYRSRSVNSKQHCRYTKASADSNTV